MADRHPLLGNFDSRKFKIYREAWPAIFRFNGKLFEEDFDVDHNEDKFREISPEYAQHSLGEYPRGIPGSGNEPAERPVGERANPATCLHRVIEGWASYGLTVEHTCVSCGTDIPAEHWEGRLYKYLPEFHRWEQVGPSPRKKR